MQIASDGGEDSASPVTRGSRWADAAILFVSVLVSLLLIEAGYRVAAGLPIFKLANWRVDQVVMVNLAELKGIVDPVLGWTNKPWNVHEDGYTTIDYGIRKNFDETGIRPGAILAVGDSFTEGWEVKDYESWPAFLEKLTKVPVVNGGTGGYGADQTVLRARQLLPIVKPKILILGFHEAAITRVGYSVFGAPKPYFTLENDAPKYHRPKLVEPREERSAIAPLVYAFRDGLGYSAAANFVLARLSPNFWYGSEAQDLYNKVDIDNVKVACALLRDLKTQTDKDGIHMMLFLQYYAPLIIGADRGSPNSQAVGNCASAAGIRVVDQFSSLHDLVRATLKPNAIRDYYWYYDGIFGHMTAKGNAQAASLIAPALHDWLPAVQGWSTHTQASPSTMPEQETIGVPQP